MLLVQREQAWRYFYEHYRGAVEALFRREGLARNDAEDLAQEFFLATLNKEFLSRADPERGRFRSYLKTAARRFLGAQRRKEGRQKRRPPGGVQELKEEIAVADGRAVSPEDAFDLAWARAVLERGKQRAQEHLAAKGRATHFQAMLLRQDGASWPAIGEALGTTAGAARGWVARAEKVLARFISEEVAGTVPREDAVADELRQLSDILGRA